MNPATFLDTEDSAAQLSRATVYNVLPDGTVVCDGDADEDDLVCDVLRTSEGPPLQLGPGDVVLVWFGDGERGVILGRVGAGRKPAPKPKEVPEELVLEAKSELTLRCGDGFITLRADGKVLIKGKDLVSRAQRTNRIKGGAVQIN